jgi:adenylate cyclase
MDIWYGASKSPKQSLDLSFQLSQKAISLDESLGAGHRLLGAIYLMRRQYAKALAKAEEALALDPNSADYHANLGRTLIYAGRPEESIPWLKKLRLSPIPQGLYFYTLGNAYIITGQYEEAIQVGKKAIAIEPENLWCHGTLTCAYSLAGREDEARSQAKEMLRINPKFSVEHFEKIAPFKKNADRELFVTAMRGAGLK